MKLFMNVAKSVDVSPIEELPELLEDSAGLGVGVGSVDCVRLAFT